MEIPIYQVDAFADKLFSGNPAAVCVLSEWLPPEVMQGIAAENNLSETAFIIPEGKEYAIRWFTPGYEINLCGHGTLSAGHVIFNELEPGRQHVVLSSKSGPLTVVQQQDYLTLDFPARHIEICATPPALLKGLGLHPAEVYRSNNAYVVIVDYEGLIQELRPDFSLLATINLERVIVSSRGTKYDFVSRYFMPRDAHREDPVTGAAHCVLAPYWSKKLGKKKLHARQLSVRGGDIVCEVPGDRVLLSGKVIPYLKGKITV